jgi:hypothetical protein
MTQLSHSTSFVQCIVPDLIKWPGIIGVCAILYDSQGIEYHDSEPRKWERIEKQNLNKGENLSEVNLPSVSDRELADRRHSHRRSRNSDENDGGDAPFARS